MNPERVLQSETASHLAEVESPSAALAKPLRRFLVRHSHRWDVVPINEVDWIESVRNYVVLHCGKDQHVVRDTLINLEARLPASQFMRISRSTVVAFDRIRSVGAGESGVLEVVLRDGTRLPASRGVREIINRIECA